MYTKHFIGMLFGLILMAVIGLGCLYLVNKSSNRAPLSGITPAVTQGNTKNVTTKK